MKNDAELCEWLRANSSDTYWESPTSLQVSSNHQAADRIEELVARSAQLEDLVRAVAHIGVDFGHGEFDLDDSHIRKARKLIEQGE